MHAMSYAALLDQGRGCCLYTQDSRSNHSFNPELETRLLIAFSLGGKNSQPRLCYWSRHEEQRSEYSPRESRVFLLTMSTRTLGVGSCHTAMSGAG